GRPGAAAGYRDRPADAVARRVPAQPGAEQHAIWVGVGRRPPAADDPGGAGVSVRIRERASSPSGGGEVRLRVRVPTCPQAPDAPQSERFLLAIDLRVF